MEDGSDIQNMAIARVKETYGQASAVLVLEKSLLLLPVRGVADIEVLSRILCSKWNSRLWTYQEGFLAKRLYFQFADGPYDPEKRLRSARSRQNLQRAPEFTGTDCAASEFVTLSTLEITSRGGEGDAPLPGLEVSHDECVIGRIVMLG